MSTLTGNGAGEGAGSGFGYSGRSLEQLRALSGSVDNGRIGEMQGHFTSVAEQVDDVVSQLVALRKDLPNWWKGEAADTAMASFDRVISHAQSTHEVAAGAAHALKICSTVVGEQQSAMSAVPEVDEPTGMPLVRQPFQSGTAESAIIEQSQTARYEAARAQAVGVVDGLAAQFVETRAKLASLGGCLGDGFQPIVRSSTREISANSISATQEAPHGDHPMLGQQGVQITAADYSGDLYYGLGQGGYPAHSLALKNEQQHYLSTHSIAEARSPYQTIISYASDDNDISHKAESRDPKSSEAIVREFPENLVAPAVDPLLVEERYYTKHAPEDPFRPIRTPNSELTQGSKLWRSAHPGRPTAIDESTIHASTQSLNPEEEALPIANPVRDRSEDRPGEPMLTPATGSVSTRKSEPIKRGKRPDYPREPRDSWLTDQAAAPYGGLLTPDWAEHQ